MALKFLYALGLFLCLSTVASSNECMRHCNGNETKVPVVTQTVAPSQEEEADNTPNALIHLLYI